MKEELSRRVLHAAPIAFKVPGIFHAATMLVLFEEVWLIKTPTHCTVGGDMNWFAGGTQIQQKQISIFDFYLWTDLE